MTTIFAIKHHGKMAIAGDGQVTLGNQVVMKHTARKVRRLFNDQVVAGFVGSVADASTLFEKFEANLHEYNGNLQRAAVELAKERRGEESLRGRGAQGRGTAERKWMMSIWTCGSNAPYYGC